MPIPYVPQPTDVADVNQINSNFSYLVSKIGELSGPNRIINPTEFTMGGRNNVLFTGSHDQDVDPDYNFFQISYNADWNYSSAWRFSRFVNGLGATAIRMGSGVFEVMMTSRTDGSLNKQMDTVFKMKATSGEDYMYLPKEWSIKVIDGVSTDINHFRLTRKPITPYTITENSTLNSSVTVYDAFTQGIPTNAKAITVTTDVPSGGPLRIYMEQASRHWKYGVSLRGGGEGFIRLGQGAYAGKYVVQAVTAISNASIYITDYWV